MGDTLGITLSIEGGTRKRDGSGPAGPALVLALECSRPDALSARWSLADIAAVTFGRGRERSAEVAEIEGVRTLEVKVPDRWMSSRHARLEKSFGRWVLTDTDSKNGTVVNGELVRRAVLGDGDVFELGHTLFLFREALITGDCRRALDYARDPIPAAGLATLVPALAAELDKLQEVAPSEIPVLIQGESGTGKEVLARAVHALSERPGEFVAVNCGAIPANLVESELFGHMKGAFSGALDNRTGLVRSAHRGTLFLDEIGDLPPASQAALLRVLQEREVVPVGATKPVPVDLRVIAATHRDLDAQVEAGSFRQDLFARLVGFRIVAPPLRERREDLGLLVGVLYGRVTRDRAAGGFEIDAARQLFGYDWPLNIRELEQALATASVLAKGAAIALEHLPEAVRRGPAEPAAASAPAPAVGSAPERALSDEDRALRDQMISMLEEHGGNVSAIARALGKDRKQIQRWLKRFDLDASRYR